MIWRWVCAFLVCIPSLAVWAQVLETDSVERDYSSELVRSEPSSPNEALESLLVQSGFRVELVASEPLVVDPIAIAFDSRGALYVVEMRGYSEQPDDKLGRVRRLDDTDGDGVYDQAAIFLSGLSWPTAIACYDGGVILGHPPDLQFCRDTDGDGQADHVETWATGFGRQNVQGMMNSFVWGLDGRLYGSTSSNGGTLRGTIVPQQELTLRRRDFAIQFGGVPRLQAVSGGGQHGMSFDRDGNRYVSSNSNHIQWVEWEQRYAARNPYLPARSTTYSIAADGPAAEVYRRSPVEPWREVRTRLRVKGIVGGPVEGGGRAAGYFTGATGVTIYLGDAFPASFDSHTNAFVGDVGGNLVHHKVITTERHRKTARRAMQADEFLTSSDTWFRPCQFANGPDGALYVVDMYRETIEHPLSLPPMIKRHLDLTSGGDRGRIYRVVAKEHQATPRRLPGMANAEELVGMLGHSNGWHRETAMRRIIALGPEHASKGGPSLEPLLHAFCDASQDPRGVVRAMYCLHAWNRLGSRVISGLRHTAPLVRIHALRMAESMLQQDGVADAIGSLTDDPDVNVRIQLALSLGELPVEQRIDPLLELADQDTRLDKMRYAILTSLDAAWLPMAQGLLRRNSRQVDPDRGRLVEEVLRQLGMSEQPLGEVALLLQASTVREQQPRWLGSLLRGVDQRGASLAAALRKRGVVDPDQLIAPLLRRAIHDARDGHLELADRAFALQLLALADFEQVEEALAKALAPSQPSALRVAASSVASRYGDPRAGTMLLEIMPSLEPEQRRAVLDLACQRRAWATLLLDQVDAGTVNASELAASQRQQLLRSRHPEIASRAAALLGATSDRQQVYERYVAVLEKQGHADNGRKVFEKLCTSCHRLDGKGFEVGPDLQPLRNRGAAFFLVNVLDPNREVDARYHAYTVLDQDGIETTGMLTSEAARTITLTAADGKQRTIRREAIESMRSSGKSLMPEGFEQDLDEQALTDLIAYLIAPASR